MADPQASAQQSQPQRTPTFTPADTSPEPGDDGREPPEPTEPSEDEGRSGTLWKVILALGLGIAMGVTSVLLGNNVLGTELSALNLVVFIVLGSVVATIGTIPLVWGWYVVPAVTLAFFGLNVYNLLNTGNTIYEFVSGEAMGYALLGPGLGLVVGYVLQIVYKFVAGE